MTDAQGAGAGGVAEPRKYAKDYWDIVFAQLQRRKLFKLGMVMLALLYGAAIYAPFLANDRPYVLSAIDYKAYGDARRSIYAVTLGLRGKLAMTPEAFEAQRTEGSTQSFADSLESERDAVRQRLDVMRLYLPDDQEAPLAEYQADVDAALDAALAGDPERAVELGTGLKDRAKAIRAEFEARKPAAPGAEPGDASTEEGGVLLEPHTSYPLFEATSTAEVLFMVLWALVLTWPFWNGFLNRVVLGGDRDRIRDWRRRKFALVPGISLLAALGWLATGGGGATFDVAPYKAGLTSGEIHADRVLFPPIPFGFAETHLNEFYRGPTWLESSAITEDGLRAHMVVTPEGEVAPADEAPPTPVDVRYAEPDRNSSLRHPLGTDALGRDLLARMVWGARVSLSVGLVGTVILMFIGVVVGCIAGYFGGLTDMAISRIIEIVICFPVFFLILVVIAFIGPSIINIMIVIGLIRWTGVARLARGEFLRLKEQDFVVAARSQGLSSARIVFRHMLPNAIGPLLVAATFSVAAGILVESSLSYLGFGIQPPTASWGSLINESKNLANWWIMFFPGLLILITVICYNLVGDGIRDAMDPKMKA